MPNITAIKSVKEIKQNNKNIFKKIKKGAKRRTGRHKMNNTALKGRSYKTVQKKHDSNLCCL